MDIQTSPELYRLNMSRADVDANEVWHKITNVTSVEQCWAYNRFPYASGIFNVDFFTFDEEINTCIYGTFKGQNSALRDYTQSHRMVYFLKESILPNMDPNNQTGNNF